MARLDRSDKIALETEPLLRSWVRYSVGILSLGVAIFQGIFAYGCLLTREIARAVAGPHAADKAQILGITFPFPLLMTLLVVLCLLSAFIAVYVLFFPAQSSAEN
jgi:hypothetical protein